MDSSRRRAIASAGSLPRPRRRFSKLGARRREDEDLDGFREALAHLPRPLPVDLQEEVAAFRERGLDDAPPRAVQVSEDVGVLDEFARGDQALEFRAVDEVVVLAVDLTRARLAGGAGHREREPGAARHDGVQQARLARARGRRDDVQVAALRHAAIVMRKRDVHLFRGAAAS